MWAALGYICPVYARYVETSGKGPGVLDRGERPKDGGLKWYDSGVRMREIEVRESTGIDEDKYCVDAGYLSTH